MGEADGVVWGVVWIVQQQSNVRTLRMLVLLRCCINYYVVVSNVDRVVTLCEGAYG